MLANAFATRCSKRLAVTAQLEGAAQLVFPSKAKDDRLYILYLQSNLLRLRPTTMIFQPPLNDSRHRTSCRLSLVVRLLVEPLATQVKLLYSFVAFIRRVGVLVEACLEGASWVELPGVEEEHRMQCNCVSGYVIRAKWCEEMVITFSLTAWFVLQQMRYQYHFTNGRMTTHRGHSQSRK